MFILLVIIHVIVSLIIIGLVLDRLTSAGRGGLSAVHFAGVGIGIAVSAASVATLTDWRTGNGRDTTSTGWSSQSAFVWVTSVFPLQ